MPSADTQMKLRKMQSSCSDIVTKSECVETIDIITVRPIDGTIKIFKQGAGPKTGYVVMANQVSSTRPDSDCEAISGGTLISKASVVYSGTPYKITTLRYMK